MLDSPHLFIGSVDWFVEKFERCARGSGSRSFMVGDVDELAPVVERSRRLAGGRDRPSGPLS